MEHAGNTQTPPPVSSSGAVAGDLHRREAPARATTKLYSAARLHPPRLAPMLRVMADLQHPRMATTMGERLELLAALLRATAAAEVLPRFGHARAQSKADGSLITDADRAVQARIVAALQRDDPAVPVLGEEMSPDTQQAALTQSGSVWVLDPLDGTGNFACGYPGFALSLALLENGQPRLGAILDPLRDECFTAEYGRGAWLNGVPIRPFAPGGERLADALATIDLKRIPARHLPRLLEPGAVRSQRNLGAVALDWCWLAAGRYQVYLHGGQRLWDYAAGRLIATEAGVASALYRRDGAAPVETLDLEPRLALAAATPTLFARWRDFVALPLTP